MNLTLKEACQYLNLKESRIRYLVFKRRIPFLKIGSTILFQKAELNLWLKSKMVGACHE